MENDFVFDNIDRSIADQLQRNGRASNQQIAEGLGLTAVTVAARIRRMEDANQLRVIAVSDFSAHGHNFILQIAVEVDGRAASDVASDLAIFPEVFAAYVLTGHYDVGLLVALRDFHDLSGVVLDKFSKVRGIRSMRPNIAVDIIKFGFGAAAIEDGGGRITASPLDDLDRRLIELLSHDARISNRKIAADLDVTEGTVRVRIKRLLKDRLIAFTAITGFSLNNHSRLAFISVQAEADKVRAVSLEIANLGQIKSVMVTMGQFNVFAISVFDDLENFVEQVSENVLSIEGVQTVEASIAVKTVKQNSRLVRITSQVEQ